MKAARILLTLVPLGGALFFLQGCGKPRVIGIREQASPTPALKESLAPPVQAEAYTDSVEGKDSVYLAERISIITDTGIRGFNVGTQVYVLSHDGNKFMVTAQKLKFSVAVDATTTNLGVVRALIPQQVKKDEEVAQLQLETTQQASDQKSQSQKDLLKAQKQSTLVSQSIRLKAIPQLIAIDRAKVAHLEDLSGRNNNYSTSYTTSSSRNYPTTYGGGSTQSYPTTTYSSGKDTPEEKARRAEIQRLNNEISSLQAEQSRLQSSVGSSP